MLLGSDPHVHGLAVFTGETNSLLMFRTADKHTDTVVSRLVSTHGIGAEVGVIDIIALQGTKPRLVSSSGGKRKYRVRDRLSLDEIYDVVDSMNHLTFNYLGFVVVAALIADVGLATNSPAVVVASMLVSPLMGPIMAVTFGTAMRDASMVKKGLRNEFIGFALCYIFGMLWGFGAWSFPDLWGTNEQISRGTASGVYAGIALAIPSGAGVALATTGGGISALVGVAISAALLPPICLSGMYLAYGIVLYIQDKAYTDAMYISMYSLILFTVNFVLIYLMALLFFRLKQIRPSATSGANAAISDPNDWLESWDQPLVQGDDDDDDDDDAGTGGVGDARGLINSQGYTTPTPSPSIIDAVLGSGVVPDLSTTSPLPPAGLGPGATDATETTSLLPTAHPSQHTYGS